MRISSADFLKGRIAFADRKVSRYPKRVLPFPTKLSCHKRSQYLTGDASGQGEARADVLLGCSQQAEKESTKELPEKSPMQSSVMARFLQKTCMNSGKGLSSPS